MCNRTTVIPTGAEQSMKIVMRRHYTNVSCHAASTPYALRDEIFQIVGLAHERFAVALERLIISGILNMYNQYYAFIAKIGYMKVVQKMEAEGKDLVYLSEQRLEFTLQAFTMTDWKMLSIFILWASLLGISCVAIIYEKLTWKYELKTKITQIGFGIKCVVQTNSLWMAARANRLGKSIMSSRLLQRL